MLDRRQCEPQLRLLRKLKLPRHHADHGVRDAVDRDRAADDRGIAAEPASPQPVAQHDDRVGTWLRLVVGKQATEARRRAVLEARAKEEAEIEARRSAAIEARQREEEEARKRAGELVLELEEKAAELEKNPPKIDPQQIEEGKAAMRNAIAAVKPLDALIRSNT